MRNVELREQVAVEIERPIFEDVHFHAGEDAEGSELAVEPTNHLELIDQPFAIESVRHGQSGRMIGEHHVLVSEGDRGACHDVDRCAAIAPRRMGVAVALQRASVRERGVVDGDLALEFDVGQVVGHLTRDRLRDHLRRRGTDARKILEPALLREPCDLVVAELAHDLGGTMERLGLGRGCEGTVEEVHDAVERFGRRGIGGGVGHVPILPGNRSGHLSTCIRLVYMTAASPPPADTWDPTTYHRFRAERRQPFDDLLSMVQPVPGGRVVDLGCGSGELTAEVHRQVGAAETVGIDRSANMLEQAVDLGGEGLRFEQGDLAQWSAPVPVDVVFANASLQWVPDHPGLLEHLTRQLTDHCQLAVQVPANFDHPTHTIADRIGQTYGMDPVARFEAILTPEGYAGLLDRLGYDHIDTRLQVYVHRLPDTASVIEWVKGTLLTQYRRELGETTYEEFLGRYRDELLAALGDPAGSAPYTFLFKRILFHAQR
jgi:trans-aconitate 2-methyltransferase